MLLSDHQLIVADILDVHPRNHCSDNPYSNTPSPSRDADRREEASFTPFDHDSDREFSDSRAVP